MEDEGCEGYGMRYTVTVKATDDAGVGVSDDGPSRIMDQNQRGRQG
jgi:hypothetical protein